MSDTTAISWCDPFDNEVDPAWRARLEGYVDVARVGKKKAGRLLDGVEHLGMPTDEIPV